MPFDKYEKKDLRDDVKLNLPKPWKLDVYKVISGDSGKEYWVQVLRTASSTITLCTCPEGTFKAPLIVLGLSDFICKHGKGLLTFLEADSKKT